MCKSRLLVRYLLIYLLIAGTTVHAQTKAEISRSKHLFVGEWLNKKEKRHLSISYETSGYMLINEWQGNSREHIDAYRAFIKGNKLIMPAYKSDPVRPYTDMIIRRGVLWHRCKCGFDNPSTYNDSTAYTRIRQ